MKLAEPLHITSTYEPSADVCLYHGDCRDLLKFIPDESVQLIVTSPPYNLGKEYEYRLKLEDYLKQQKEIIAECVRVLGKKGSICWEVGNYVENGEVIPLDTVLYPYFKEFGLRLRNRIVWRFEHGLHCSNRFSGRYETINWFTKSEDYFFNLDPVRIPQKYPEKKYFKGPKKGMLSSNPLGKNPGDVWDIPNVKANHVEKTIHPCQYPIELVERLVLSLTKKGDWVFDPFLGVGSTAVAAIIHGRRAAGAEILPKYLKIAKERVLLAHQGLLKTRPMHKPIHNPNSKRKELLTNIKLNEFID